METSNLEEVEGYNDVWGNMLEGPLDVSDICFATKENEIV